MEELAMQKQAMEEGGRWLLAYTVCICNPEQNILFRKALHFHIQEEILAC